MQAIRDSKAYTKVVFFRVRKAKWSLYEDELPNLLGYNYFAEVVNIYPCRINVIHYTNYNILLCLCYSKLLPACGVNN